MTDSAERDAATVAADERARERALDPSGSFIVRAPAGAGKTELLTRRYLALLARVNAPEELLAITFTVKAAAEMRARVLAAFRGGRDDRAPEDAHARRTWTLARGAVERDREREWQLADNPSRLRIQTVDALCMRLARSMPVLASFGSALRITEDPWPLYEAAATALLDELQYEDRAQDLERLLLHLDGDMLQIRQLIAQMLAERDRWIRHVADPDHPSVQREELEAGLRELVVVALRDLLASVPGHLSQELPALAALAAGEFAARGGESPLVACVGMSALPGSEPEALPAWRGIRSLLLTGAGKLRVQVDRRHGFPAPSSAADAPSRARLADARQRMRAVLRLLDGETEFIGRLEAVDRLPAPAFGEGQWALTRGLLALLPRAVAALKVIFAAECAVDFTEIAHAALRALGDPGAPTDLALSLDCRLSHIMVDEFQDTSYTQLALLERLTAGWQGGDGRTLFLVGDPMQSIYRFRDAEVSLFERVRSHGIGEVRPTLLTLSRNFRAQGALVEWTNASFEALLPSSVRDSGAFFSPAEAARAPLDASPVTLHARLERDDAAEAETVSGLVSRLRESEPGASVAVLVRARQHAGRILRALRDAGVRYRALDLEPLGESAAVMDLHVLTRALLHLGDRVAWLALLRAPWCGLTLGDLHALTTDQRGLTVWEAIIDERMRDVLSDDGRRRLSRLKRVLADSLGRRGRSPLRRWVGGAWAALGGWACARSEVEWKNAQRYLGLLEEIDRGGEVDSLASLERALARLRAEPDPLADGSLQVMTIHRAKGLEFDHVVLPGLGRLPGRSHDRLLRVTELASLRTQGSASASRLALAPLPARGESDAIGDYLARLERERDRSEQLRLIYVAVTRARRHLYLLGDLDGGEMPAKDSLLASLWPALGSEFVAQTGGSTLRPEAAPEGDGQRVATWIRRLPSSWELPPAPTPKAWRVTEVDADDIRAAIAYVWASDVARHVGVAVHLALQQIGHDGMASWQSAPEAVRMARMRAVLSELGMRRSQLEAAARRAFDAVADTLRDERGRWILDASHAQARSEYAVSGWVDGRLINVVLDRTFVDATGVRWIIDFKTGSHEGARLEDFIDSEQRRYRPQLQRYAQLMRCLDPRATRVALYFPLLQAWREWSP